MSKKNYCYVDETRQNTLGKLFVVSVVLVTKDREDLIKVIKKLEVDSGKY